MRQRLAIASALLQPRELLILDEPTNGLDPVARHEVMTEFMDVLRDDSRSILFSSHNTVDVERISDRITFIDRGRVVDCSDKEDFLERWRRIHVQLPSNAMLPDLPGIVSRVVDGQFVTLTTNSFSDGLLALLGNSVRDVQRMSLEEIFVANVFHHREARGQ
jgi:ABC-2 type transport system ATP-binding protein